MSIGPAEIVIVLILALLVFGPKRLPQMGKSLGKGVREFRKAADTAKQEFGLGEVTDQINEVKSTFTEPIKEVTGTFSDLKSSVDVKSAIEAPVAAKGAAVAGAAGGAARAGASGPATPAQAAAQDVSAGVEGYEMPATSPTADTAASAPDAPSAPDAAASASPATGA
ncbi:MAG: twin-arginine translocase TatA/TatE family subunit [Deltaproteobacteria bacterium]